MFAIVNKNNNVVERITKEYPKIKKNTLLCNGAYDKNQFDIIETNENIKPMKYKHIDNSFVINQDFIDQEEARKIEIENKDFLIQVQQKTIDLLIHIVQENNLTVSPEWVQKIQKYKQITS